MDNSTLHLAGARLFPTDPEGPKLSVMKLFLLPHSLVGAAFLTVRTAQGVTL